MPPAGNKCNDHVRVRNAPCRADPKGGPHPSGCNMHPAGGAQAGKVVVALMMEKGGKFWRRVGHQGAICPQVADHKRWEKRRMRVI